MLNALRLAGGFDFLNDLQALFLPA